jgi:hypothetical protein
MATIDYQARLDKVQAAITSLLDGGMQQYTIDGQSVTKLDLDWLSREEARLVARISRQNRRTGAFRNAVPR